MGIVELVHPTGGSERWQQHWGDLGMNVTDFSFEISSDLLVLMEYRDNECVLSLPSIRTILTSHPRTSRRIHFRTISENTPNPLASKSFFDVHKYDCAVWDSCLTLMHNDHVALHFAAYEQDWAHIRRRGGALVFNWRTGVPATVTSLLLDESVALIVPYDRNIWM